MSGLQALGIREDTKNVTAKQTKTNQNKARQNRTVQAFSINKIKCCLQSIHYTKYRTTEWLDVVSFPNNTQINFPGLGHFILTVAS